MIWPYSSFLKVRVEISKPTVHQLTLIVKTIAEICPSRESTVVNPGRQVRSNPLGATYPRAIAIALTAWFTADAPTALIFTVGDSYRAWAIADPTDWALDPALTRKNLSSCSFCSLTICIPLVSI